MAPLLRFWSFSAVAWLQQPSRYTPLDDAEIAFCTRAEGLKRLFISLALVGGQRNSSTIELVPGVIE
jgi:hypothetical protein